MIALGSAEAIADWFAAHALPINSIVADVFVLNAEARASIADFLVKELPDCYISKDDIEDQVERTKRTVSEIVANKFADPGSVMAGDFGEILTLFFLGTAGGPELRRVKKWRYKQDRNKAAPHSDVILLHCPDPANPSPDDYLICAEAKVKSTASNTYRPIEAALKGYEADRTGRLAKTLAWLREKALETETADTVNYIERFSKKQIAVTYNKNHRAVALIDTNFLDAELIQQVAIPAQNAAFKVVVMGLADLKVLYEECFARAAAEAKIG